MDSHRRSRSRVPQAILLAVVATATLGTSTAAAAPQPVPVDPARPEMPTPYGDEGPVDSMPVVINSQDPRVMTDTYVVMAPPMEDGPIDARESGEYHGPMHHHDRAGRQHRGMFVGFGFVLGLLAGGLAGLWLAGRRRLTVFVSASASPEAEPDPAVEPESDISVEEAPEAPVDPSV